jgi:DtxR family transcriptional regulator, Mn-dependent transcriptional regulator
VDHPALILLLSALLLALAGVVFWPRWGLWPLVQRALRTGERELTEDALKHLYDCEYQGTQASLQSIAGALEITAEKVARLVMRLEALGLVKTEESGLQLTPTGRSDALRIIRIHRLWEVYLADRTGFAESEWHPQADLREHQTTAAELEYLTYATGNPRFDPHGDPIPTPEGEIPSRQGISLGELTPGTSAKIVHVEDEPEAIYAQLRAQNISLNKRVTVLDKSPERIRLEVDGEEQSLAPVVAGNVWVSPMPRGTPSSPGDRLSSLSVGETRRVAVISPACKGLQRRRLLDLGLLPGTEITAVFTSPTGDPTAYRIRDSLIALRKEQADQIYVQTNGHGGGTR